MCVSCVELDDDPSGASVGRSFHFGEGSRGNKTKEKERERDGLIVDSLGTHTPTRWPSFLVSVLLVSSWE